MTQDDFHDPQSEGWCKRDIFLLTYSVVINIVTLSLILYVAL